MTIHMPARANRASVITTIAAALVVAVLAVAAPGAVAAGTSAQPLAQGLGMGDKPSVRVRELQRALQTRGFDVGAPGVDGRFGPLTASAVRRLQGARGLVIDGIVGQHTRAALGLTPRSGRRAGHRSNRSATPNTSAPGSATPNTESPAPAPPAMSDPKAAQSKTLPLAAILVFLFAIAAIAGFGVVGAWRSFTRRADRSTPERMTPAAAATPLRAVAPHRPEPVIGYVTMTHGATADEHDRSSAVIAGACKDTGRELVEIVCDYADGRPLERPGLMHALGRIADGEARGLVVAELGTFSRSARDLATLLAWFRDADATLVALDLLFDTATPGGRQAAGTLVALGNAEKQRGREEGDAGHAEARSNARTTGRPAVRDRPELLERIAAMRSAGMTLREIADQLNAEHVPTSRGGAQWRPSSIQAALGYRRPGPRDRMPPVKAKGG
jgi:DNA invertase Pin-like site-specific DNA recombinase/peptidoglycan hydrolase-like protein with peptidoglycan-binding domain